MGRLVISEVATMVNTCDERMDMIFVEMLMVN